MKQPDAACSIRMDKKPGTPSPPPDKSRVAIIIKGISSVHHSHLLYKASGMDEVTGR